MIDLTAQEIASSSTMTDHEVLSLFWTAKEVEELQLLSIPGLPHPRRCARIGSPSAKKRKASPKEKTGIEKNKQEEEEHAAKVQKTKETTCQDAVDQDTQDIERDSKKQTLLHEFELATKATSTSEVKTKGPLFDPLLRSSPSQMFRTYGYALLSATPSSARLAERIRRLPLARVPTSSTIAGGVEQIALSDEDAAVLNFQSSGLQEDWNQLIHAAVEHVGIEQVKEKEYSIVDYKILIAKPDKGEQAIHLDREDDAGILRQVYSLILYCTSGVDSTSFPTFPTDKFVLPITQVDDSNKEVVTNAAELRAMIADGCLDVKNYHRCPVKAGDIAIFSQALPHYGTVNRTHEDRITLFSVLTPFTGDMSSASPSASSPGEEASDSGHTQDKYQFFRWQMFERAFGSESRELAFAVWQDRYHAPIHRFTEKEDKVNYNKNLIRWKLLLPVHNGLLWVKSKDLPQEFRS